MNDINIIKKYKNKLVTFIEFRGIFLIEDVKVINTNSYVIVQFSCIETNNFVKSTKYVGPLNIEEYVNIIC